MVPFCLLWLIPELILSFDYLPQQISFKNEILDLKKQQNNHFWCKKILQSSLVWFWKLQKTGEGFFFGFISYYEYGMVV